MINDDQTVRTDSDHRSMPTVRVLRISTSGLGLVLLVLSVSLLTAGVGAGHDGIHTLNLGLTLACLAGMCGVVAAGAFIGEQIARTGGAEIKLLRREIFALRSETRALRALITDLRAETRSRLEDVEAGERAIAGAVRGISAQPDELGRRRGG